MSTDKTLDFPDLTISLKDEYFITVGQYFDLDFSACHSFVAAGVVLKDKHEVQLLARVGKSTGQWCFGWADSALLHESIKKKSNAILSYQAYTMTREQMHDFLFLIQAIEQDRLKNDHIINQLINESQRLENKVVSCYCPSGEGDKIRYVYQPLNSVSLKQSILDDRTAIDQISRHTKTLSVNNTCRTSALEIMEWVLQFKTTLSSCFLVSPNYEMTLNRGAIMVDQLYILPAPPKVKGYPSKQTSALTKLYRQLENIPKQHRDDPLTKQKFDALKALYLEMLPKQDLDLNVFLASIIARESQSKSILFQKRSPCFFSRVLNLDTSTTKQVFEDIKVELRVG